MFEREHHRRVASVLEALDAELLAANACLFGGGTAIALKFNEYRESVDLDFMVSDRAGYRALRALLTGPRGVNAIARPGATLQQAREVRADQYGVRTMLTIDGVEIKFEIVLEGRISLEPPGQSDRLCGVATLTPLDMVTSKLLANSDRWADDAVLSRDLIDLAMMVPSKKLLRQAIDKAAGAYATIEADLAKAIAHLLDRPGRLEHCMKAMRVSVPKALLWEHIKALSKRSSPQASRGSEK